MTVHRVSLRALTCSRSAKREVVVKQISLNEVWPYVTLTLRTSYILHNRLTNIFDYKATVGAQRKQRGSEGIVSRANLS